MTTRNVLIGKVHVLAKQLDYDEATYRTVLLTQTGRTSCRDMTWAQLSTLTRALERLANGKPLPSSETGTVNPHKALGRGEALPSAKQWATLTGMAERAGWSGLEDFRLLAFARHTVKVAELGEMTRSEMSKVITGLSRMLDQGKTREGEKQ